MNDIERERKFREYGEILNNLKTTFMENWKTKSDDNAKLEDFERFRTLGTGAFGRVILVKYKKTSTFYAMKILDKRKLAKLKQIDHTRNEKQILQCVSFPFTVFMEFFFKVSIEKNRKKAALSFSFLPSLLHTFCNFYDNFCPNTN